MNSATSIKSSIAYHAISKVSTVSVVQRKALPKKLKTFEMGQNNRRATGEKAPQRRKLREPQGKCPANEKIKRAGQWKSRTCPATARNHISGTLPRTESQGECPANEKNQASGTIKSENMSRLCKKSPKWDNEKQETKQEGPCFYCKYVLIAAWIPSGVRGFFLVSMVRIKLTPGMMPLPMY